MNELGEKDYKAQWDAETLAEAKTIEKDPGRFQAAQDAASRLAEEQSKKASSMKDVARKGRRNGGTGNTPKTNRRSNRNGTGTPGNSFNVFQKI